MSEPRVGRALGVWLVLGGALSASLALADEDARQWLAAMNEAVAKRTYQGVYLHLVDGKIEQLRILHRYKDGRIAERLVSLTGDGREIIRNDTEVECYLPRERKLVVESHAEHGSLLGRLPADDGSLEHYYHLELGPRVRSVVGRDAQVLSVLPRDNFRFGYRIQIDEETRLPVRTDLCDPRGCGSHGKVLGQVVFTSLDAGHRLSDAALRPELDARDYERVAQPADRGPVHTDGAPLWRLARLPGGFTVASSATELLPGGDVPVAHFVLSDGLAMVSVFVAGRSPPQQPAEGQGRYGAVYAFSRSLGDNVVTAVGEVPPETLEFIATNVVPVEAKVSLGAPVPR